MAESTEEAEIDAARSRATALILAGKLQIELAGVVIGHVDMPDQVPPEALARHIRFEFPEPES